MATNIYEKLKALPQPIYQAFMADDVLCEEACMLYGLPEEKIASVSGPIGPLFVGDMKLADYPREIVSKSGVEEAVAYGIAYEVNKRFFLKFPEHFVDAPLLQKEWEGKKKPPIIGEREAQEKAAKLKPWLFEKSEEEAEQEKAVEESHAKLSLLAALGKYARLGEQAITSSRLTLKGNPEPVRGNLVNWLKVYRDELGVGYHDPVLRAKFLFNSPNAKNITSEERERLNLILRSVEENAPLDIDLSKMEIVFPSFQVTEQKAAPVATPVSGPAPAAVAMTPAPAPKRQGMFSSASVIRPMATGAQTSSTPSEASPMPAPGQTPSSGQSGFRVGKGMHFTSLEPKPSAPPVSAPVAPQPAAQTQSAGGGFSFSSKHAFPSEHTEEGGLSINRPSGGTLPSGQAFFKRGATSSTPAAAPSPKPAAPKMNPFQIRPVSLHGKSGDEDMGRIVDLRNE